MKRSLPGLSGHPPRLTPKTGRPSKALKGLAVHDCTYKGCGKIVDKDMLDRISSKGIPPSSKTFTLRNVVATDFSRHGHNQPLVAESARSTNALPMYSSPNTSPKTTDQRGFRPIEHNNQQILPKTAVAITPTRQSSTTTQDLAPFAQMQISNTNKIEHGNTNPKFESSSMRQLPVPWGAQQLVGKQDDIDVGLLRSASYGDLIEVRRLHLIGVDVLAAGKFENGGTKSALFAAADAIRTCFEDIQRNFPQPSLGRDRLWRDIIAKAEVIRYLVFHGADLDSLDPILKQNVQRALQGPPAAGVMEQRMRASGGYRLIAAASPDVKLPPMEKTEERPRRESLSTAALGRIKADDTEEAKGNTSS